MSDKEDRLAFERIIEENFFDPHYRLVFADWLEERGLDVEAQEQRRRASPECIEADRWMVDFASRCGETCKNYSERYYKYRELTEGLGWQSAEDRRRRNEISDQLSAEEDWQPITYGDCIQAGHDYLEREDYFVQMGSETARDLLSDEATRKLFWKNWSLITGMPLNGEDIDGYGPFSCSC